MKLFITLLASFLTGLLLSANSEIYNDPYMYRDSYHYVDDKFDKIIRFDAILFEDDKIKEESRSILDDIVDKAKQLEKESQIQITIIGHTDRPTDDVNELANRSDVFMEPVVEIFEYSLDSNKSHDLSDDYAKSVQKKLVDAGLDENLTVIEARSGFDPAFSNATREGRELSNRVMVTIYTLPPEDIDSDRDGVYDRFDRCPATPRNTKVDIYGCPLDSDKDGVVDYKDKCPDTKPIGIRVDKSGCPLDSDEDGVFDYKDNCPNTPKDVHVDLSGCPALHRLKLNFKTNSDKILQESYPEVQKFAKFLKENPGYKAEIIGHTDSRGKATLNMILSKKRAESVKRALVAEGIDPERLTTKGRGELEPLKSNRTEEGRKENRRIEVKLFYPVNNLGW